MVITLATEHQWDCRKRRTYIRDRDDPWTQESGFQHLIAFLMVFCGLTWRQAKREIQATGVSHGGDQKRGHTLDESSRQANQTTNGVRIIRGEFFEVGLGDDPGLSRHGNRYRSRRGGLAEFTGLYLRLRSFSAELNIIEGALTRKPHCAIK